VRARTAATILVLASALPRLAVVLHERSSIVTNNVDKGDTFARTFIASGTYGFIPGHPSAYTQPLYGWFLIPLYWIFGRSWEVVGIAQTIVAVATTLIVWQIGRRWIGALAGLIAGLLVALHPYLVWHDVHMNREILDELLAAATVFAILWALEKLSWRRALPVGALLGLGILGNVRLEALPLVVAGYYLWQRGLTGRTVGACLTLIAATLVVLAPWVVRNRVELGCWTVTTDARALWKANNLNTYATLKSGQWIDHVPIPKSFPTNPDDIYVRWLRTGVVKPYSECHQVSFYEHKVFSFWEHHPGAKARLVSIDLKWEWQPSVVNVTDLPGAGTIVGTFRKTAEPIYMVPLYILGVIGLFLVPRYFWQLVVLLLGYQTLAAIVFVGETRYRVPWDFLIALLAGATVAEIVRRVRDHRASARGSPAARRNASAWTDATSAAERSGSSRS
jgi:4-amino-4-deoxy-L-arabinose transferase-like glycosyltransferase